MRTQGLHLRKTVINVRIFLADKETITFWQLKVLCQSRYGQRVRECSNGSLCADEARDFGLHPTGDERISDLAYGGLFSKRYQSKEKYQPKSCKPIFE